MELSSENGASAWLTTLPIKEQRITRHKQAFRGALCLCYGWKPARCLSHCSCGAPFITEPAFSCSKGAYPSIRHDIIRDITAELLTKVCHSVEVEPCLQSLASETFRERTCSQYRGQCKIGHQSSWALGKQVGESLPWCKGINKYAPSNCTGFIAASYRRHEKERRPYKRRVMKTEHGTFTPIVLSTTSG